MSALHVEQVPINNLNAGIYRWKFLDAIDPLKGHILVMGAQTTTSGTLAIDPGQEVWFEEGGSNHSREIQIELLETGSPDNLAEAMAYIEQNEDEYATAPIVPSWTESWSIPRGASLYTVTEVHWEGGGTTTPVDVLGKFSVLFLQSGNLVAPRWFRTDGLGVSNIFGFPDNQTFTLQAGSYVELSPVSSSDDGYPQATTWEATTTG